MHLRFVKNTYFQATKNIKFGNRCIGFFKQENLLYIKRHLSENLLYISKFVKKYKTVSYLLKSLEILTYQQTVLLKIIYDFRIEISFIEKCKFLISR